MIITLQHSKETAAIILARLNSEAFALVTLTWADVVAENHNILSPANNIKNIIVWKAGL